MYCTIFPIFMITNKDRVFMNRQMKKSPNSTRNYITIGAIILSFAIFFLYLFNFDFKFDRDRSTTYNVKIIPSNLDDSGLNALNKESFSYLAMIDAGSSGCRAHVYRYGKLGSIEGPLYILPQHLSKKVKPGLSSFASNPADAGPNLVGLVEFLKEQVPESDWAVTPIWLKATAGLRMLKPEQSEEILNSVRRFLSDKNNSPFLFRSTWAKVIPGKEEGGFGWIAFNYLKRIIGPKQNSENIAPYAVVEMGGASSQVSQLSLSPIDSQAIPDDYRFDFEIEGKQYTLYTYSYLGYGGEQSREALNRILLNNMQNQKSLPLPSSTSFPSSSSSSSSSSPSLSSSSSSTSLSNPHPQVIDPCLNLGYTRDALTSRQEPYQGPAGMINVIGGADTNGGGCIEVLKELFTENHHCNTTTKLHLKGGSPLIPSSHHSFGCVYQPHFVSNSVNFLTFENFFYISSALAVPSVHDTPLIASSSVSSSPSSTSSTSSSSSSTNDNNNNNNNNNNQKTTTFPLITSPRLIQSKAMEACRLTWSELHATYPKDNQGKEVNTKLCFGASYAYAFLVYGLKLSPDKLITIQKEVLDSEIEWALGAAYKETADFLKRTNLRPT